MLFLFSVITHELFTQLTWIFFFVDKTEHTCSNRINISAYTHSAHIQNTIIIIIHLWSSQWSPIHWNWTWRQARPFQSFLHQSSWSNYTCNAKWNIDQYPISTTTNEQLIYIYEFFFIFYFFIENEPVIKLSRHSRRRWRRPSGASLSRWGERPSQASRRRLRPSCRSRRRRRPSRASWRRQRPSTESAINEHKK